MNRGNTNFKKSFVCEYYEWAVFEERHRRKQRGAQENVTLKLILSDETQEQRSVA